MDIKRTYGTVVEVLLKPIWFDRRPTVRVSIADRIEELTLEKETTVSFVFEADLNEKLSLNIEHYGKTNADNNTADNLDTAVIVERITLNGITSPRFVWAGLYTPQYDPAYVDEYRRSGIELEKTIKHCNYLGWNGVWSLEFTVPVFTWIHQLENLGWIYD